MKFNLSNKELIMYLIYIIILLYIWKLYKIKIHYLFPFIIFILTVIYIEQQKEEINIVDKTKTNIIISEIYDEKYEYLEIEEIVLFIDTLRPIRIFNIPVFNSFLSEANVYMKERDMSNLLRTINTFESLYFVIPVELTDFYTERIFLLKDLLFKYLVEEQKPRVEMQSYVPYDYIRNNISFNNFDQ